MKIFHLVLFLQKGGSLYHFKSSQTPGIIEKAILIVEGFDVMDSFFAEELYDLFNKQKLADCILDNNYDIFMGYKCRTF